MQMQTLSPGYPFTIVEERKLKLMRSHNCLWSLLEQLPVSASHMREYTQRDPIFKNTEERMAKGKELATLA